MALTLKAAMILDYNGNSLEQLFEEQFGLAGINEGGLGDWLAS